ncbi:hypothetical protein EP227_01300 [bacterium]|nr:MAG: hypothetical protein EP227_01300 [bacterium]
MIETRRTRNKIPTQCLEWLVTSRIRFFDSLREGNPVKYLPAHLPVMSTWNGNNRFPVNMTVKGLGLLPKPESLQHYTDIFESVIAEARTKPWSESLKTRVEALLKLYNDQENFDPTILGGLEIFNGKAFENLRGNPYASLLYVGMNHTPDGMRYVSFQVNSSVIILEKGNPYYRFLLTSRKLFEFEKFHLYQPDYPFGYLFNVEEVIDKSPWSRKSGKE